MTPINLTRRMALMGAIASLGGCSAVSALNSASKPLDTYDLAPVVGSRGGARSSRTLLVVRPEASAAIATDRIMVKPDAVSITYLPDARWSDEAPLVLQSLLIRSISGTGRIGYVGRSDGGPIPDTALLVRMDAFHVNVLPDGTMAVAVDIALTVLNDRDQRVIATRSFAQSTAAAGDSPAAIVAAFQAVLDALLPGMADWVLTHV
ncbi:MAG: ABC-type transport auxiliary lipoprotein family protein [Paracoccus sp. (in: a-proteobacteria)]|nr:ABC-type transport auxiliary lipoprotein family protein [Paracoccus sp. (in: a-proteobacteria)]